MSPRSALRTGCGLAIALLAVGAPAAGAAQAPPRALVGAGLGLELLVGDANDFLDGGGSRFLMADIRPTARDGFHIRFDGSLAGLDPDEDEGTGARAENDLLFLVAGPQLSRRFGRWRPYVGALAGLAAVAWSTDAPGVEGDDGFEAALAVGAHAGLAFTLDESDHPVGLRVEVRLLDSGELDFARAPDPAGTQRPTGITRQDVASLGLRIAFTLGF